MALTPEQLYKLGAESLGWNNSTTGMGGSRARDRRIGGFGNLDQKQQLREMCLGHEPDEVDQSEMARLEQL